LVAITLNSFNLVSIVIGNTRDEIRVHVIFIVTNTTTIG